MEAVSRNVESG